MSLEALAGGCGSRVVVTASVVVVVKVEVEELESTITK